VWVRFSGLSLVYPLVAVPLAGLIALWEVHRRISGPLLELEVDTEETTIRKVGEKSVLLNLPLTDRILWLCITLAIALLLLVHLIKRI